MARRGLRILHRPPPPPPQQVAGKEEEEPLDQEGRLYVPAVLEALRNHARPENIGMLFSVSESEDLKTGFVRMQLQMDDC